ncbi:unnamed protein product, partial [Mesorhabditis belari]|uniref:Uncharacterized protein n=1 Tax=Mesorhabditis belari TaxID=2138241 RepID=A0AAF3J7C8_9BILA
MASSATNFAQRYLSLIRRRKMCLLYADEFVTLNDYNLTIRNFHFPSKRDRKIQLENITIVYFEDQETCKYSTTSTWGKATSPIFWALDMKRELHCLPGVRSKRSNVVLDIGQELKIGFTVEDIDAFMESMRNCLDYHVIIVNSINL